MAKIIKFNLTYGNTQIRDLEELKSDCNIDMLLDTFKSGQLEKWLVPQNVPEILEKVKAIPKDEETEKIAPQLCEILLDMEISEAQKASAKIFDDRKKEMERLEKEAALEQEHQKKIETEAREQKAFITNYFAKVRAVFDSLENASDLDAIINFSNTLKQDFSELFDFYMYTKNHAATIDSANTLANSETCDVDSIFNFLEINEQNYNVLEIAMNSLYAKYKDYFSVIENLKAFYERFFKKYPFVMIAFLVNKGFREIAKQNVYIDDSFAFELFHDYSFRTIDAERILDCACEKLYEQIFLPVNSRIKILSAKTGIPIGTEFMKLKITENKTNTLINARNVSIKIDGERIYPKDYKGKFIDVRGLFEYMLNNSDSYIIYLES